MKDIIIIEELEPITAEQWRQWATMPSLIPKDAKVITGSFKLKIINEDGKDKYEITDFKIHKRDGG
jgi:hypothetical protein